MSLKTLRARTNCTGHTEVDNYYYHSFLKFTYDEGNNIPLFLLSHDPISLQWFAILISKYDDLLLDQ